MQVTYPAHGVDRLNKIYNEHIRNEEWSNVSQNLARAYESCGIQQQDRDSFDRLFSDTEWYNDLIINAFMAQLNEQDDHCIALSSAVLPMDVQIDIDGVRKRYDSEMARARRRAPWPSA